MEKLMVNKDMKIAVLSKLYILEKMNFYLAIQGTLLVYKKIKNRSVFSCWHFYSSLELYKNAFVIAKFIPAS